MALISSIASDNPRTIASPDLADWPDMAATSPSLMVSCAVAGARTANVATATIAIVTISLEMLGMRSLAGMDLPLGRNAFSTSSTQRTCHREPANYRQKQAHFRLASDPSHPK